MTIQTKRHALLAAGVVGLTMLGAPPAQAAQTWSCNGTLNDATIRGDVVVPAGAACELDRVTVRGSVTVHGNLLAMSSSLRGHVHVAPNGYFNSYASAVGDGLNVAGWGAYLDRSSIRGDAEVTGLTSDVLVNDTQVNGNYKHRSEKPTNMTGVRIRGSLDAGGQLLYADGIDVSGRTNLSNASIVISNSRFRSNAHFNASTEFNTMLSQGNRFTNVSTRGFWSYFTNNTVTGVASDGTSFSMQGTGNRFLGKVRDKYAECFPNGQPDALPECRRTMNTGQVAPAAAQAASAQDRHDAKVAEIRAQARQAGKAPL